MFLLQVPTAPDSMTIVTQLTDTMEKGIPWLDPAIKDQVAKYVSHLLLGIPVTFLILLWEVIGKNLGKAVPWIEQYIGQNLAKFSWIINPVLGGIIGGAFGDSTVGLAAGVIWSWIKNIKFGEATLAGLTKAKQVALILGLLLVMPHVTSAQTPKPSVLAQEWNQTLSPYGLNVTTTTQAIPYTDIKKRGSMALGLLQAWEAKDFTNPNDYIPVPKGAFELGYTLLDWAKVRGAYYKTLTDKTGEFNVGVFVFF